MNTGISTGTDLPTGALSKPYLLDFLPSRKRPVSFYEQSGQWLLLVVMAVASYFCFSRFLIQSVEVVGKSMTPTLHDSDRYLLNRCIYYFRAPQRTEVVVIRDPLDKTYSVKRIIAAEGESVYLKDGQVYVNGEKLAEPYLPRGTHTFDCPGALGHVVSCGRGEYFVLGDNRGNSADSRIYGPVSRRNIIGTIMR